jgi:uncharacterized membrane protein
MSSAEATVDETVLMRSTVRGGDATRAATVLALLAVTQLTWIGALVYGAIWLLT